LGAVLIVVSIGRCLGQNHEVLCNNGEGRFQAEFQALVTVTVGATKSRGLSTRTCEATLAWNKQAVTVSTNVAQVDLDAFGIDLGLGVPVAAFQIKNSANQCCTEYKLYSLDKSPRLLRTITGGGFFSAGDTDLDGRVEIWTTDAAAVNGLERLDLAELDSAPTLVLRFEERELYDVSSEFQTYFDRHIALRRKQLKPEDLRDFKSSDGILSVNAPAAAERTHRLRQVKIKILEIVWNYLYSGRETQAWSALAEMWPDGDVARIRAALVDARARGILAQVATAPSGRPAKKGKGVRIFDAEIQSSGGKTEVTPPVPILLRRPPPPESSNEASLPSEVLLELTIDSAGKVRSAEPAGNSKSLDAALLQATTVWKFIPARSADRPVASRMRLAISLRR